MEHKSGHYLLEEMVHAYKMWLIHCYKQALMPIFHYTGYNGPSDHLYLGFLYIKYDVNSQSI